MKPLSLLVGVALGEEFKSEKFINSEINVTPAETCEDTR